MSQFPRFRYVGCYDRFAGLVRACRWIGTDGTCKLTLAIRPSLFHFHREQRAWFLAILGVRLHYRYVEVSDGRHSR